MEFVNESLLAKTESFDCERSESAGLFELACIVNESNASMRALSETSRAARLVLVRASGSVRVRVRVRARFRAFQTHYRSTLCIAWLGFWLGLRLGLGLVLSLGDEGSAWAWAWEQE